MSENTSFLDDSDLEDELFLIELAQQVTSSTPPSTSSTVSQQQQQLNLILYWINIKWIRNRDAIRSLNNRIDNQLNQVRNYLTKL